MIPPAFWIASITLGKPFELILLFSPPSELDKMFTSFVPILYIPGFWTSPDIDTLTGLVSIKSI